jgi:diguanylate cyclase (GGDEF)-like protein
MKTRYFPRILAIIGSFRGQLTFWFGGLALASLLSVGLYLGRIATEELATSGGESLYTGARSAADLLASNLNERVREIELLRQTPLFMRGDLSGADVRKALQLRQQGRSEYAWVGVADVHGRVQQAVNSILLGQDVSARPWFQAARSGSYVGDVHEAVLLSKLLPQRSDGQPLRFVDIAAPILDERGRLRGVIGAHVHWSWVARTVESVVGQSLQQRNVEILIADRNGVVLSPFQYAGQLRLPEHQQSATRHEILRWPDGRDYLTSIVDVTVDGAGDLGWRIALRQPADVALAPVQRLRERLLLLGLVITLLFAAIAYRFATRISRPVEQLAHAARQAEQRSAPPRYPQATGIREIDMLSSSVQSMTTSLLRHERELEQLNASLEQQVRERTAALSQANEELQRLAVLDPLTGVGNRRRFDERLHEHFLLLRRSGRPYALLLVDADHFKRINDHYGHPTGDAVLRQLAQVLRQGVRATDSVARYGGEEFAVLLADIGQAEEAHVVAEKIRLAVAATVFPQVGHVTVSIGASCATPADHSETEIVKRADEALYRAKAQGRNQVVAG